MEPNVRTPRARPILDMNAYDAAGAAAGPAGSLLARRQANIGAASVLFYREPIEMVSARGCWMEAADGRRYLDFYNNVPSVGHAHPHVVEAIARQVSVLNIHTRYLNRWTEDYLDRLKATLPAALSNVVLTCTGSEANDLAMRIATEATGGQGFVVTEAAYHGNTLAVTGISPSALKRGALPTTVETVPAPGSAAYGNDVAGGFRAAVEGAVQRLAGRGVAPAALICDSIFSSDGVFADPPGFLAPAAQAIRAAGGLFIADEVQPGFARTGAAFWGFARHAVTPDIVTMGKPMANGYPMGGVAASPDLVARFCETVGYFNTFGGNPVAAAAGLAVLDVMEAEGLQENARVVGVHVLDRLRALSAQDPRITGVRGAGLFIGVDLCRPGDPGQPDPELTTTVINGLRDRCVLIGAAGRYGHTLKVRPPLCLTREEGDLFVDALADTLASQPPA
ncbi:aspartate aminotransferase family protein [Roseospira marina]|uniref:Aspartate aminotransferase family protein n=1 Tax=Roseospira marina TaxID=140057 RepID=A0A5M6IBX3_9PROT|nr:aspartate aminotransferase family protein [Roseospira marina]KAA5605790.1 aspartate aminotransferase family protein [Roseospira marina]MBB4313602.1 4-aminobutyrate aminotransferase-like enzyme [Roseospira marina]MBB5086764.1 4-aminobutyrate aminotransferase-like enzyme [Roseospira marina]